MGDVLGGEFENSTKFKPLLHAERARVQGENPYILALGFSSVDMSTLLTRYAFATLKLDILSLRVNSI